MRHHPLSTQALVQWLEKQDPKGKYNYENCAACLCAQYFKSKWYKDAWVGVTGFSYAPRMRPFARRRHKPLPNGWRDVAAKRPHTFGAALKRARKLKELMQ